MAATRGPVPDAFDYPAAPSINTFPQVSAPFLSSPLPQPPLMTDIATYSLVGRLDGVTSATHETALREVLLTGASQLEIDLASLDYISSAGLRVLLMAAKSLKAKGGTVALIAPKPAVLEVLHLSGFDKLFAIRS
jgi:anti-anti-sigma factor